LSQACLIQAYLIQPYLGHAYRAAADHADRARHCLCRCRGA
jgi:hypothetical protein